jgi:hypothetical protein
VSVAFLAVMTDAGFVHKQLQQRSSPGGSMDHLPGTGMLMENAPATCSLHHEALRRHTFTG